MHILNIKLQNFRCFDKKEASFEKGINIIYGNNATGKTSILESINCLGIIKSFRCNDQSDLIQENNDYFLIESEAVIDDKTIKLMLYGDEKCRKIKKNNVPINKLSDYLGYFDVILFSATDFLLLKGANKDRIKLLDLVICQISKDYIAVCNYYKNLLKERNALLKSLIIENSKQKQDLLSVISSQMIEYGKKIIKYRSEFVKKISDLANIEHLKITDNKEKLEIIYSPSVSCDDFERELKLALDNDLRKGHTTVGPHRDDCIFIINNKNTANFGSQGQQRNALLSAKLGMAKLLYEYKGDFPVLLLDDVFSELDKNRQNSLIQNLNNQYQTIITAASISDLDESIVKNANLIKIDD